jgi:hypothetical protein
MADVEMLRMALVGYQAERQKIDEKINQLQARLRIARGSSVAPMNLEGRRPRRQLSTAARKRIADAQRKRWAAFHKNQAPGTIARTAKKGMSTNVANKRLAALAKARKALAAKRAAAKS